MLSGFIKWSLIFIFSDIVWCDTCQPEFKKNLGDALLVSYDIKRLDVTKMSLGLVDTQPFMEMFTNSCREMVKTLGVEYRVVGEAIWNRYLGRRGSISTNKKKVDINNIDPCLEYEVRFIAIANDDSEQEGPHVHFGPFHRELNQQEIARLNYESMPDISYSITYTNITSSGFTVSWGQICAQSANVFLLNAPHFDYGSPWTYRTDLLGDEAESSLWIPTQPCQEYRVAIETFMTSMPIPEEEKQDESRDHEAINTVITDPEIGDVVTTSMEEGSNLFKWKFAQQIPCLSEFSYEINLTGETGNDIHLLQSGDLKEESGSIDLSIVPYTECSNYQLQMKVSYKTKASHNFEEIVFGKKLRTNQVGKFAAEGTNDMHIVDDNVHVTFDSCNKEAVLCLTEDETLVMHLPVTADTPNVPIQSFLEVTENCVEYKISLHNNETDYVYAEAEFPTKPPKEEVDFQMTDFTISSLAFEVLGAEENSRCSLHKYTVTCKNLKEQTEEHMILSEFNDVDVFEGTEGSSDESIEGSSEESIEGSGFSDNVTLHSNEDQNTITAFMGASANSSNIEIANLTPKTLYKCEASIDYDVLGNIKRIDSSHIIAETEGFDGLEITEHGNIVVTCNSRIEEFKLALVHWNGKIVVTVNANCIDNDHIDMFKNKTEECVEYAIQLYEAKELEKFILNNTFINPSLLAPIDSKHLPAIKGPESVPELQFVSSHNSSLTFDILIDTTHHCNVTFYCVTCSNGRDDKGKHHSVDSHVTVDGLERDDTYNCSAHVEFQSTEVVGSDGWIRYSSTIEAQTEGFDEMDLLEDGDVLITCGSNIEELNIILVEEGGRKVATKEASCNDTTSIEDFIINMKPCGKYKIKLIARKEYDELIEQGKWDDGEVTVFAEVDLDFKQSQGQPELKFAASHPDSVELDIVDELNVFCGVETIEVECEGKVDDTNVKISKVPSSDELLVPSRVIISGLSPDNSYTCSAMVQYSEMAANQTLNVTSEYNTVSNPLVVKTSKGIPPIAEPKSNSNTIIYIVVAVGGILGILIVIIVCKRRKSGGKDFIETANQNVVHHKDTEKANGTTTDVEVQVEK